MFVNTLPQKNIPRYTRRNGFLTIISVLVAGSIATAITVTLLFFGTATLQSSGTITESIRARNFANACAEEALLRLRESVYYSTNFQLSFTEGLCSVSLTGTGNSSRTIEATGTAGTAIRKLRVVVATVHPIISTTSWQEVADF